MARQAPPGARPNRDGRSARNRRVFALHPGWSREAVRKGRPRGMVAYPPRGGGQNPAYRPPDRDYPLAVDSLAPGFHRAQAPDSAGLPRTAFTPREPLIHTPEVIAHRSTGFVPRADVSMVNGGITSRCFPYSPMVSREPPRKGHPWRDKMGRYPIRERRKAGIREHVSLLFREQR
jgi:hypothetical protein